MWFLYVAYETRGKIRLVEHFPSVKLASSDLDQFVVFFYLSQ